jgi:flagellar basal-body rod protein FlgG
LNNSMISASVSLNSLQQKLDILSNNIANANTTGFKRKQATFEDVLTNVKNQPQGFMSSGRLTPLGFNQGWGSRIAQIQNDMSQGAPQQTNNLLDFAIQGDGMFQVATNGVDDNGNPQITPAWTRDGAFQLSPSPADGDQVLTTKDGHFVLNTDGAPIHIPNNYQLHIASDGIITAVNPANPTAAPIQAGQLRIVRIVRPQLLQEVGDNLYKLPSNITEAQVMQDVSQNPGIGSERVTIMQGYLEQSNVILADEMTDLISVQRAFQLNSRAITSSDTMMGLANNLRA